ncbi:MAG: CotH kinase family protein [Ignavibacteriales bacterium]|nr:CotH kinase family protein [Ignavibacteriales bacterium]
MSSNSGSYLDEFGGTPDWIELFNGTSQSIDLEGFSLSDKRSNLQKWVFPQVELGSEDFLLINASGRDLKTQASSWHTVIDKNQVWKYFLGTKEPPSGWKDIAFNDIGWNVGFSGFGYGDGDDQTQIDPVKSIYLRKNFTISDLENISILMFNIDYDDGFVAFLNGKEIARANLGAVGEFIPFNKSADNAYEANLYQNKKLESFFVYDVSQLFINGNNVITIQVNNYGENSSDLTAIPFLTIGYKASSEEHYIANEAKSSLPKLHANFSIGNGDETIFLSNNFGEIIDSIHWKFLESDVSFGRQPDGSDNWFLFNAPTPNSSNITSGFLGQTQRPELNLPSGFYSSGVTLSQTHEILGTTTYYTLDGSEPSINSNILSSDLKINTTAVVKLKSFSANFLESETNTFSYFINENKKLPVVSISTDPENLWNYNTGIYVLGPNAEKDFPYFDANFWQDWVKPATFQFFDLNKDEKINIPVNIKIYGAWSRGNSQKSLSVEANGNKSLKYKFFPNLDLSEFKSIVLRNSGNDWTSTMLRDGFIQTLAADLNIDRLAFQPAILYLNGEYWGIQNIREKINLNYLEANHNVDKDKINLLELDGNIIDGSNEGYWELIDFLNSHNLSLNENYDVVKSLIDISSFIDYNIMEIYISNTDWPGNNNKFWRSNTENGKWRWILFDTDFGFGFIDNNNYLHNTLQFALESSGPEWPNPPWSTFILRKLLENEKFKNDFVIRFADLSNTLLKPENVKQMLDVITDEIQDEILNHIERWHAFSFEDWEYNISVMKYFADLRISYLRSFFRTQFGLSGLSVFVLNVSDINAGKIEINSLLLDKYTWTGDYFNGTKVKVIAKPNPGYEFTGWSGSIDSIEDSLDIDVSELVNLTAIFQKVADFPNLIINEINYNSNTNYDVEDWIELYNNSDQIIDLSKWIFKDQNDSNKFVIPQSIFVKADDYIILARDTANFRIRFNDVKKLIGNFDFGLSNGGDLLRLYNSDNEIIDSVRYDDSEPWPILADGTGNTLELKNPNLDNSIYSNWASSTNYGTPGKQNTAFIITSVEDQNILPAKFSLEQNYPNPFNPTTTIKYSIPSEITDRALLKIYDILGREVITLGNEVKKPGTFEVEFDASKLSSGIYFYTLKAGSFYSTKKMMLLK